MAFYVSGGCEGNIGAEKVKKKAKVNGKIKKTKITRKTHPLPRRAPSRARTRHSRGWGKQNRERNVGRKLFAGGGGVGFGRLFVEFAAGHAFGCGFNFAFAKEFVVGG
jgi:hypothetical protein